jgi:hypothetical protein
MKKSLAVVVLVSLAVCAFADEANLSDALELPIIRESARGKTWEQKSWALDCINDILTRETGMNNRNNIDPVIIETLEFLSKEKANGGNDFHDVRQRAARYLRMIDTGKAREILEWVRANEDDPLVLGILE